MRDLLSEARKKINDIDKEMARLFIERMKAAEMVAEHKREHGLEVLDPVREAEVLRRNSEMIEDELYREYYMNFQKNNMALSRMYQARILEGMRVAYSGTEGAYAHIASSRLFPAAKKIGYKSFEEAYEAVVSGECDAAVLPIENSYNGEVGQVTDLMFSGPLYINTVTELAISHDLLAPKGTRLEDIKTVISHPQALGQCRGYILKNGFDVIEHENTAMAAEYVVKKNDPTLAAIASSEAAEIFGLDILATNINEARTNTTRFAVFSRAENKHPSDVRQVSTIILFTVKNEAGALAKAIDIVGKHGYSLAALRSRPMKELLWQYYFYLETEGNLNTENGKAMLKELGEYCDRLKTVGTFTKRQ